MVRRFHMFCQQQAHHHRDRLQLVGHYSDDTFCHRGRVYSQSQCDKHCAILKEKSTENT